MQYSRRVFAASLGAFALLSSHARAETAISGAYTVNGKAATLTQVTAHKGDPVFDKPVTEIVFTAKDQKGDPKAAFNAVFNKYGDAIVVKVAANGDIVGADLAHSGWSRQGMPVSTSGTLKIVDFSTAGGEISGRLTSSGVKTFFDDKFEVDITFKVKAP